MAKLRPVKANTRKAEKPMADFQIGEPEPLDMDGPEMTIYKARSCIAASTFTATAKLRLHSKVRMRVVFVVMCPHNAIVLTS